MCVRVCLCVSVCAFVCVRVCLFVFPPEGQESHTDRNTHCSLEAVEPMKTREKISSKPSMRMREQKKNVKGDL